LEKRVFKTFVSLKESFNYIRLGKPGKRI